MTGMVWPVSSDKWEAPLVSMELIVGKKTLLRAKQTYLSPKHYTSSNLRLGSAFKIF